jgi:D-sedoheptulose 7-phosphate isomerase
MKHLAEIAARIEQTRTALAALAANPGALARAIEMVTAVCRAGNKVLIFGNGGSAAEAQHIAAELVNRMSLDRAPLAAIALATDGAVVTSIANDYSFREIFVKQVEGLGRPGDLCWGLSTSGRSPNVIAALRRAGELGLKRLAMTGRPGAEIETVADLCLCVDSPSTPVVQEVHLCLAHIVCDAVERELFGGGNG